MSSLNPQRYYKQNKTPRHIENNKYSNAKVTFHSYKHRASLTRIQEHTKIFASMCPDEILDHYDNYKTRSYYTTLMLGDVSGFTDLTEKYTKAGKGGPSKLTETLNSYIGAMVQEILSHNGDVLKFSGDAFIVMWKLEEGRIMRDLAIEAMQTACVIQKHFGTYDTDVGVTLRVKLAIASGKIFFTSIGDPETMSYYIITGKPVWDVKFAEGLCRGGDIIVSRSSWQWVDPNEYVHKTLPDGMHTLIVACASTWYQSKRPQTTDSVTEEDDASETPVYRGRESMATMYETPLQQTLKAAKVEEMQIEIAKRKRRQSMYDESMEQVDYSLRPKVIKAAKAYLKNSLRSYMLRPVIRSVEKDEPLEYLTEMRQVVILFINVITTMVNKRALIALVDETYKFVCGIVGSMQGCVNKTSLFDKDLMFLCVFGLRGDKHELESQIGLRCASKLRKGLITMRHIKSVTIGVTTGITYCGVVGHILRREYTVIGMPVNKAARLMIAYTNKVVCDRESFLHSHLEARHFLIQEPRTLKGITHVGPIYEFREQDKHKIPDLIWSKHPLLGRDAELKLFLKVLNNLSEYYVAKRSKRAVRAPLLNTLIIVGEPRIGKTRLLDEIAQNVPPGVSCNYISLVSSDVHSPYALIHLIFWLPLGFGVDSSAREREDKLLSIIGKVRQTHYLCALNQLFNVRFNMTQKYKSLSDNNKQRILSKLLLKLMKGCFRHIWIIIIDDAEYADDESLQLFKTLVLHDLVLFILSIGKKLGSEYKMQPFLLDRAKIIELTGIDKWYHAGLACQAIGVTGLPAELEKLIQEKSEGNPGWIESYLLSLIQAEDMILLNIVRKEAERLGYVLPPAYMLRRVVTHPSEQPEEDSADKWQMYKTSFIDSSTDIQDTHSTAHKFEVEIEHEDDLITVCAIPSMVSLTDTEVTMDSMIVKLFDSLTPLDQFLLKCASVLGEIVNRRILESLMETTSKREIGLAIAKLFEIRVFGCAAGDFSVEAGPILYSRKVRKRYRESGITCGCTGITIPEELKDLPKYASCGLMRFKMTMFRDTTQRLLTETQKMELHSKALKYLQQNTTRCIACGGGQFAMLLGKTFTQEERKKTFIDIDQLYGVQLNLDDDQDVEEQSLVIEAPEEKRMTCFNIFRRLERKSTNTFSNVDFTNCQCDLILTTVYTQMLDHCQGIGKYDMIMTAILEFVEVCLATYNIPQARKLLTYGEELLYKMFHSSEEQLIILPYLAGKIQTYQGKCYLESGLISEAEIVLNRAMRNLGYTFPRLEILIGWKTMVELKKLKLAFTCLRNWKVDVVEGQIALYTEQLAYCLAHMFDVFRAKGLKKHARLAAIWGLNAALLSNKNFIVLCTCFTNMMITAHIYHNKGIIPYLECEGINLCDKKKDSIEIQELKVIVALYAGIFFLRWQNGQIEKGTKMGFVCVRLAQTTGAVFFKLLILPRLIHLLMISCKHSEVVALLRQLEFACYDDADKSGRTWYYALCVDVQLDTGLLVLSFRHCEEYYSREGETMINLRDTEAARRYLTSMWLWCIRTGQWEAAKEWNIRNVVPPAGTDENVVVATITSLKKLEGLLMLYVHRLNSKNVQAAEVITDIRSLFKSISKNLQIAQIVVPRYTLLKAYYHMILSHKNTALKLLQRAKKISRKAENKMILLWVEHCERSWSHAMSSVQEDLWNEKLGVELPYNWQEVNANDTKIIPFTLPLPKYAI